MMDFVVTLTALGNTSRSSVMVGKSNICLSTGKKEKKTLPFEKLFIT